MKTVLPKAMPSPADAVVPDLKSKRVIMCSNCNALYDGGSHLRQTNGELVVCPGSVIDKRHGGVTPCGSSLGEFYRGMGGKQAVRPRLSVTLMDIAPAFKALWQREDFADFVINEDPTRPSSFRRTKYFKDFIHKNPALATSRGLVGFTLYVDYLQARKHARIASKGQIGSVYLRPNNLPPHLAMNPEFNLHVAVLNGLGCSFCCCAF